MLLMDEVLPEASLPDFALQVAKSLVNVHCVISMQLYIEFQLYYTMADKLVIILFIQHARVALRDYTSSRFSRLLINISGLYPVLLYIISRSVSEYLETFVYHKVYVCIYM